MKKIILLLITIILLTGCNATYDINIKNDKISDTIKVFEKNNIVQNATNEQTKKFSDTIGDWENGYDYYQRELYTTDEVTGYKYTYDFNYEEYDAMSELRKCYKELSFEYDNQINLKTSNEFLCANYYKNVDSLEINITSEYHITNSNADKQENNKHTWIINKNNYKNKPIQISINKNKKALKKEKETKIEIKSILAIIAFIILILILKIRKKETTKKK